jgi:hypothetical protein
MKKLIVLLFISVACIGQGIKPEPLSNFVVDSAMLKMYSGSDITMKNSVDTAYSESDTLYCYAVFVPTDSMLSMHYISSDPDCRVWDVVVGDTLKYIEKTFRYSSAFSLTYRTEMQYYFLDGEPFKPKRIILQQTIQRSEQNN